MLSDWLAGWIKCKQKRWTRQMQCGGRRWRSPCFKSAQWADEFMLRAESSGPAPRRPSVTVMHDTAESARLPFDSQMSWLRRHDVTECQSDVHSGRLFALIFVSEASVLHVPGLIAARDATWMHRLPCTLYGSMGRPVRCAGLRRRTWFPPCSDIGVQGVRQCHANGVSKRI